MIFTSRLGRLDSSNSCFFPLACGAVLGRWLQYNRCSLLKDSRNQKVLIHLHTGTTFFPQPTSANQKKYPFAYISLKPASFVSVDVYWRKMFKTEALEGTLWTFKGTVHSKKTQTPMLLWQKETSSYMKLLTVRFVE